MVSTSIVFKLSTQLTQPCPTFNIPKKKSNHFRRDISLELSCRSHYNSRSGQCLAAQHLQSATSGSPFPSLTSSIEIVRGKARKENELPSPDELFRGKGYSIDGSLSGRGKLVHLLCDRHSYHCIPCIIITVAYSRKILFLTRIWNYG